MKGINDTKKDVTQQGEPEPQGHVCNNPVHALTDRLAEACKKEHSLERCGNGCSIAVLLAEYDSAKNQEKQS